MKKAEMRCVGCIKFDEGFCRANPRPLHLGAALDTTAEQHWCAQGVWHKKSKQFPDDPPFRWHWEDAHDDDCDCYECTGDLKPGDRMVRLSTGRD